VFAGVAAVSLSQAAYAMTIIATFLSIILAGSSYMTGLNTGHRAVVKDGLREKVSRDLHQLYAPVLHERIPDDLRELLAKLK
jgi:hypothetical protein